MNTVIRWCWQLGLMLVFLSATCFILSRDMLTIYVLLGGIGVIIVGNIIHFYREHIH